MWKSFLKFEGMEKYESKIAELESLVKKIEDTSRPLGEISADVRKAVTLISECRSLLREEQDNVEKSLQIINS